MRPAKGRIVVGYDHTVPSGAALRWAAREAARRRAALLLLHVADTGDAAARRTGGRWEPAEEQRPGSLVVGAQLAHRAAPGVDVETCAVVGTAGVELVAASHEAD